MPDREVSTIQDLIFYQYAKLVARSAFHVPDGRAAKSQHYGFVKQTFRDLKTGTKQWPDITREDWQLAEAGKKCAYCGASVTLHREHIVPQSLRFIEHCAQCPHFQEIHNQVWACQSCNTGKGTLGLYEFFMRVFPQDRKFHDRIPPLLEKKDLKTIYNCHLCANTLGRAHIDGDGEISVLDIDLLTSFFTKS